MPTKLSIPSIQLTPRIELKCCNNSRAIENRLRLRKRTRGLTGSFREAMSKVNPKKYPA
jgi:hypothetical protein